MKTAAYTICKNEVKFVEKWLYYTKKFNYRVILDTGSTDGTWEKLQEAAKDDPGLIIEQKIFTPWKFDIARNYNLDMIPQDVDWALSPDMDEYFSINVLKEMAKTIKNCPHVTNIGCDRLDVYSEVVRVGPPNQLSTNKIHRRHDYIWRQPIYEHLSWKYKDLQEYEIYNDDIYLIHDQDFLKPERSPLYEKMLKEEYVNNPTNDWNLWFLVNHYYKEKDMDNFIKTGCDFMKCAKEGNKFRDVYKELLNISLYSDVSKEVKADIQQILNEVKNDKTHFSNGPTWRW